MYMHTYIYIYICIFICIYVSMYICMCAYLYMCIHVDMWICIYVCVYRRCIYVYVCAPQGSLVHLVVVGVRARLATRRKRLATGTRRRDGGGFFGCEGAAGVVCLFSSSLARWRSFCLWEGLPFKLNQPKRMPCFSHGLLVAPSHLVP